MGNAASAAETRRPAAQVTIAKASEARFVQGRRAFFTYRDLGVTEATAGRMRAQITAARAGMVEPTGWHWHECESQFIYVLSGWIDLEFDGSGLVRLEAGDSAMIPGGLKHQEVATSDDFELLEVSNPARMETVACEAPSGRN